MISSIKKKTVAYISGTRADFGLMTPILKAIQNHPDLELLSYATGMHLMPTYGETIHEIKALFTETKRIEAAFDINDPHSIVRFATGYFHKITDELIQTKPDIVLILGDRIEMLCSALAAFSLGITIAHVHGGDKTKTVDDAYRHAITKLAHMHLPATQEAADRIKKLGEEEWRIHLVGAPALDVILHEKLPTREELFRDLGLNLDDRVILVTQHPVSEDTDGAGDQMNETFEAVKSFDLSVVVTYPNADTGSRAMVEVIERERQNQKFKIFKNLSYRNFLALEREAVVWVGNSSGAMIESASFGTPVVNIGGRQAGRVRSVNVIDVPYEREQITRAIERSLNDLDYRATLKNIVNPWGDGKTGERVANILANLEISQRLLEKQITY
ncbi:UDP-N-acetylglucosamine 2-epimerase (hydrolyzing) [Patescibacteria group bacterium]|nr:UDP-N-acetylglucosamine 2-epimerase (hydrolyzing) [Patescibacteria group bacterium]